MKNNFNEFPRNCSENRTWENLAASQQPYYKARNNSRSTDIVRSEMAIDRTNVSTTGHFVRSNNSMSRSRALQSISHDFCKNIQYFVPKFATPLQFSKVHYNLYTHKPICHSFLTKVKSAVNRAVARTLIGGVYIHIFRFCLTSFF